MFVLQYLHIINLNVLRNFITLYWAIGPYLNQMGLKKDMRNEHLFFKRVTDIIIPDYPLTCKNVQRSKRHVLVQEKNYQLIGIVLENPNSLSPCILK